MRLRNELARKYGMTKFGGNITPYVHLGADPRTASDSKSDAKSAAPASLSRQPSSPPRRRTSADNLAAKAAAAKAAAAKAAAAKAASAAAPSSATAEPDGAAPSAAAPDASATLTSAASASLAAAASAAAAAVGDPN